MLCKPSRTLRQSAWLDERNNNTKTSKIPLHYPLTLYVNQKPFKEARNSGASHYVSRAQGNLVLVECRDCRLGCYGIGVSVRGPGHYGRDEPARLAGHIQRHDDGDGVRKFVVLEPPRHLEHGKIVGALPRHDACRRGSISADPHGSAAAGSLDLIVAETLTVQATFWRSRRKWKNSMPSRRRRLIISGDMIISPTIEAIFDGRK